MSGEVFVDAPLFLGMHSRDEAVRRDCKGFFADRLYESVTMSLEHVGWCDDVVWGFPREAQDGYYPFMDNLHSDMKINRVGYDEAGLLVALRHDALAELPMRQRLLLGMVINRDAMLYTGDRRLLDLPGLPVRAAPEVGHRRFPAALEELYQASLVLRTGEDPR